MSLPYVKFDGKEVVIDKVIEIGSLPSSVTVGFRTSQKGIALRTPSGPVIFNPKSAEVENVKIELGRYEGDVQGNLFHFEVVEKLPEAPKPEPSKETPEPQPRATLEE